MHLADAFIQSDLHILSVCTCTYLVEILQVHFGPSRSSLYAEYAGPLKHPFALEDY